MGTGSFPGVESGRSVTLTPHPLLLPRSKNNSRSIPLLSLRAFVACERGETYLLTPFSDKVKIFFLFVSSQQSDYSVFHKLMSWQKSSL
jgi:hypothetical protein